MSANNINKILIIGATSGIGLSFAERFHASGTQVLITGRRASKLQSIQSSLPGIETTTWDIADLQSIPNHAKEILAKHPDIDAVFINAGIARTPNFTDPSTTGSDEELIAEITTNFTSVVLLAKAFMPHLLTTAQSSRHAALIVTSSGLGFTPSPIAPVYCATKAAVHSFLVSLREQVAAQPDTNIYNHLSISEIVPPFVATALMGAGKEDYKAPAAAMPLEEYMEDAWGKLGVAEEGGKLKREVATGSAEPRLDAWRGAIGPILEGFGFEE